MLHSPQENPDNHGEEKLILLRSLASESFGQLDQGRGIALDDDRALTQFISKIGRRAAKASNEPF